MTVFPTHTCFDDAMEYLEGMARRRDSRLMRCLLVHVIVAPDGSDRSAHAWVECDGECCFAGLIAGEKMYILAPKKEFYDGMKIEKSTVYTVGEALIENHRSGHYGPWVEEYRELCKKSDSGTLRKIQFSAGT